MKPQIRVLLSRPAFAFLAAALISLVLHWRVFPLDVVGPHAWRQTQTQLNIRHFALDDFNILHPRTNYLDHPGGIQRMEFPLMQWIVAAFCRLFGYSMLLTRILLFLAGLLTVAGMMKLARHLFSDPKAPAIAAWTFSFSPLFYYYSVNPLPDVWAMGATVWGAAYWFAWLRSNRKTDLVRSGIFLAAGTLMKLPFIVYFIVFAVYAQLHRKEGFFRAVRLTLPGWIWIAAPLGWYATVVPGWKNNPVTQGLLDTGAYAGNDLLQILWGNFSSTLPELLINYAAVPFFLAGAFFIFRSKLFRDARFLYPAATGMAVLAYFFFELHLIANRHDYYLFPFLPLIFLLVIYGCLRILSFPKWNMAALAFLLLLPLTAFLRIDSRWNTDRPGFNPDILRYSAQLQAVIPPHAKVLTAVDPSGQIWFYYLDRSGWNLWEEEAVDRNQVAKATAGGATYFVSDSGYTDEQLAADGRIGEPVAAFGTIKVYRLTAASGSYPPARK